MYPAQPCFVQIVHTHYNKFLNYIIYTTFFSKISASSVAESEFQKDKGKRGEWYGEQTQKSRGLGFFLGAAVVFWSFSKTFFLQQAAVLQNFSPDNLTNL